MNKHNEFEALELHAIQEAAGLIPKDEEEDEIIHTENH